MNYITILIGVVVLTLIGLLIWCFTKKSDSSDGSKKENYGSIAVKHVRQFNTPLDKLVSRFLNMNGTVTMMSLAEAIQKVGPNERICVLSIDNPVVDRMALEALYPYRHILAPYIDQALMKKGMRLAKDTAWGDGEVILESVAIDGYPYPLGWWMFVEKNN